MSSRTPASPGRELREWLERHEQQCLSSVETWMTRSLPVASALIAAVWPDPAWQDALRNLVVWPVDEHAGPAQAAAGFLAGTSQGTGIGLITPDGETTWLQVPALGIPHPVLVSDLEDFRDFAAELALALAEPTIKNCLRWNGWTSAQYTRAAEELLGGALVVGGTRSRAGRRIFLSGPWLTGRAPNLPMEHSKLPLYNGRSGLAGRYTPTRPVHELFGAAWQRVAEGDAP